MNGKDNSSSFSFNDLTPWVMAGVLLSFIILAVIWVSDTLFDAKTFSAISTFGVVMSALISVVLVGIYIKQTKIFERHGEIMETQSELMELQFIPNVNQLERPEFDGDRVRVTLENKGRGTATDFQLITRIEFEDETDYDSPLKGSTGMSKINDKKTGQRSLGSGETGTFEAESMLEVSILSGERSPRSFRNVIGNMKEEVNRVRISLKIKVRGHRGDPQTLTILKEEAFYTNLDDLKEFTLQECYKVSKPP